LEQLVNLSKSNPLVKAGRKFAYQQIGISITIVLIFTLIIYFIWGVTTATSALTGGVIGVVPNIIFAYKAFKYAGAKSSKLVVESFFSGVKIKMIVTALLFAMVFKTLSILPLPFFGMFCLVMAMPLLTPFFVKQ
jgi:ATP synthase protein I|tara:strand:- start:263 stop:667 length:405 start_codon:yes stop_codon:yes gene_type:complete